MSLYAETKVAVERKLLGNEHHSFVPTVLRFATLYGLSPRMRFDLTVNEFTQSLFLERRLVVYGEQFWRPYVHVSDAARAISRVLATPADAVRERVFNVGDSNENYRKSDLIRIILDRVGEAEIEYVRQGDDPRDYRVSCARIRDELGFYIAKRVPDGVDEIIEALSTGAPPTRFSYNVESVA
jgi:nucleoside-diphosphate-sugar epimerase